MISKIQHNFRRSGQALVEFALAATLIFMLLAAAVDLGLIFFTVQSIHNAAQEGATYGSRWLYTNPANGIWQINIPEIQNRVRTESGANGGGSINLMDLDSNGANDSSQGSTIVNPAGTNGYIVVVPLEDTNRDGNPNNDNNKRCDEPAKTVYPCYVQVTVRKVYDVFFPIPVIGKRITLSSSFYMLIRNSFAEAGAGTQIFPTPAPTKGASNIVVNIINNAAGGLTSRDQTNFEVTAWDTAYGTTNGSGIASVTITIRGPAGFVRSSGPYTQPRFCSYPSTTGCGIVSDISTYPSGAYTITAVVQSSSGTSATQTSSFTK